MTHMEINNTILGTEGFEKSVQCEVVNRSFYFAQPIGKILKIAGGALMTLSERRVLISILI